MTIPLYQFCLVRASDRAVIDERIAADLRAAIASLKPAPGFYVTSRASHDIGSPKPLPRHRCHSCGVRDAEPDKSDCARCVLERRRVNAERDRNGSARPRNYAGERRRLRSA